MAKMHYKQFYLKCFVTVLVFVLFCTPLPFFLKIIFENCLMLFWVLWLVNIHDCSKEATVLCVLLKFILIL